MTARKPATNMTLFPLDDTASSTHRSSKKNARASEKAEHAAKSKKRAPAKRSAAHVEVETQLQRVLGTKVVLVDKGGKGTITVLWHGYDHLDALMSKFGR